MSTTTRYYVKTAAAAVSPAISGIWSDTEDLLRRELATTHNATAGTVTLITDCAAIGGPTASIGTQAVGPADLPGGTMTGTFRAVVCRLSDPTGGGKDVFLRVVVKVVSPDGTVVRGTLCDITDTTKYVGLNSSRTVESALLPVVTQPGDRLVIEYGAQFNIGFATGNGKLSHNLTNTDDIDFVELDPTDAKHGWAELTIDPPPITGRYYFNDDAAPAIDPDSSAAWDPIDDTPVLSKLIATPGNDMANKNMVKGTPPRSVIGLKSVGDPLSGAGLLAGALKAVFLVDGFFVNGELRLIARVLSGDGLTVRGVLADITSPGSGAGPTFPAPATMKFSTTMTPVEALAGDRIVVEVGANVTGGLGGGVLLTGYPSSELDDLPDAHLASAEGRSWLEFDAAPRGLAADPDINHVDLTWLNDSAAWLVSGDVTGYQVRTDGGAWGESDTLTGHTVTGLDPSTTYDFDVRAYEETAVAGPEVTPTSATGSPPHNGGNTPANAFDADTATAWAIASGWTPPVILQGTFAVAKTVVRYSIKRWDGTPAATPTAWTFQGSNDNVGWTTLDTQAGITWPTAGQTQTFDFANATAYLHYRLRITANGGDGWVIIGMAKLYEGAAPLVEYGTVESISATTDAPNQVDAPTDLILVPDVYSINASWTPPVALPEPDGYIVTVSGLFAPVDTALTTVDLLGLSPATLYDVEVRSYVDVVGAPVLYEAVAASSSAPPESAPEHLIDSNPDSYWSMASPSGWLRVDLAVAEVIGSYIIQASADPVTAGADPTTAPRDWQLFGSDDGFSWYAVDTRSDQVFTDREIRVFDVALDWAFRYWTLSITDNNGHWSTAVAEFVIQSPPVVDRILSEPLEGSATTLNDGLNNLYVGELEVAALYVGASPVPKAYFADTLTFEI